MPKPILVVTSRYPKEVEDRIGRDYEAQRNPNQFSFSIQSLLSAADGADALFITPADRLDPAFFRGSKYKREQRNCRVLCCFLYRWNGRLWTSSSPCRTTAWIEHRI